MFRTGVPHFGYAGTPEAFNNESLQQGHDGDLGMVYIKPNGDYWQIFQNVDGAGVSGTNITGGGVAYVKNYAGFQCTPTIGNSSANEVAGIYELAVTQNYYCALRQGGTRTVKALSTGGTFARGTQVVAAASANSISLMAPSLGGALSAAADTAGAIMSVVNPFGVDVWVDELDIVVATATTGANTSDFGTTATSATTLSDNLIDGISLNATGTKTNFANGGTNGKTRQRWASGTWITGSTASGAVAGLVGTYVIRVTFVDRPKVIGIAQGAISGDGNVSVRLKIIPV
jgi:hypothetical protein